MTNRFWSIIMFILFFSSSQNPVRFFLSLKVTFNKGGDRNNDSVVTCSPLSHWLSHANFFLRAIPHIGCTAASLSRLTWNSSLEEESMAMALFVLYIWHKSDLYVVLQWHADNIVPSIVVVVLLFDVRVTLYFFYSYHWYWCLGLVKLICVSALIGIWLHWTPWQQIFLEYIYM